MLLDRGEIDLDAPVAKYWPEFAANGKQGVKIRHLLGFTAGLPGWTELVTVEDILESPFVLLGTVAQMVEQVQSWRARWGISYVVTQEAYGDALAPVVERLTGG